MDWSVPRRVTQLSSGLEALGFQIILKDFCHAQNVQFHAIEDSFIPSVNALSLCAENSSTFSSENIVYPIMVMINTKHW